MESLLMAISYSSLASSLTQKFAEFTSGGTFTPPANVTTVEVLLVAGGGAGGGSSSSCLLYTSPSPRD